MNKCFDEFIMKANAATLPTSTKRFIDKVHTKDMDRLLSEKNQEAYLNELKTMNTCPDCIKALTNNSHICPSHGHHHQFTKYLAAKYGANS